MTLEDLGRRVFDGHLLVAGELRACRPQELHHVDTTSGLKYTKLLIVYAVECQRANGMEIVKVNRYLREPFPDPDVILDQVRNGLRYAFECVSVARDNKTGLVTAIMDAVEPVALDGVESATPAPAGAGVADSDA